MRIENTNIGAVGGNSSFGSVRQVGGDDTLQGTDDKAGISDTVSLSNASSLISLAKNLNISDRQSRISSLAADFRSGSYQPNTQDVAQALLRQSS